MNIEPAATASEQIISGNSSRTTITAARPLIMSNALSVRSVQRLLGISGRAAVIAVLESAVICSLAVAAGSKFLHRDGARTRIGHSKGSKSNITVRRVLKWAR